MDESALQPEKIPIPMEVTPSGIVISEIDSHLEKAYSPMSLRLSGRMMD